MIIEAFSKDQLMHYTISQINMFFPDDNIIPKCAFEPYFSDVLDRLQYCFKHIKIKYFFCDEKGAIFNYLNSDHYAMYLYILSNTIWLSGENEPLAAKVFLLNKCLHSIDAFYKIQLPEIFLFAHPIGTILGNAVYSNYFVVHQNCTIGSDKKNGDYPIFEGETLLFSNASVIGKCKVGSNTVFSANAGIINSNIDKNSLVFGVYPDHKAVINKKSVIDRIFRD